MRSVTLNPRTRLGLLPIAVGVSFELLSRFLGWTDVNPPPALPPAQYPHCTQHSIADEPPDASHNTYIWLTLLANSVSHFAVRTGVLILRQPAVPAIGTSALSQLGILKCTSVTVLLLRGTQT